MNIGTYKYSTLHHPQFYFSGRSTHCLVVNVLDCDIVVNEFKLKSRYYIQFCTNTFVKGMKPFILILRAIDEIVPLLFYNNGFAIRLPTKVDMPLKKKLKTCSV